MATIEKSMVERPKLLARSHGLMNRSTCAEPIEHHFHAMGTLPTTTTSNPLVSTFIPDDHHDNDDLMPMLASLRRCMVKKKVVTSTTVADQQHCRVLHRHIKRLLQPSDPPPLPSPASLWDRMWNGLVKT
jgi:hypothetical protein